MTAPLFLCAGSVTAAVFASLKGSTFGVVALGDLGGAAADLDAVQRAVALIACVMRAVFDGTCDAVIDLIHSKRPPEFVAAEPLSLLWPGSGRFIPVPLQSRRRTRPMQNKTCQYEVDQIECGTGEQQPGRQKGRESVGQWQCPAHQYNAERAPDQCKWKADPPLHTPKAVRVVPETDVPYRFIKDCGGVFYCGRAQCAAQKKQRQIGGDQLRQSTQYSSAKPIYRTERQQQMAFAVTLFCQGQPGIDNFQ